MCVLYESMQLYVGLPGASPLQTFNVGSNCPLPPERLLQTVVILPTRQHDARRSSPRAGRLVRGVHRQQLRDAQPSALPRRPTSTAQRAGAGDDKRRVESTVCRAPHNPDKIYCVFGAGTQGLD